MLDQPKVRQADGQIHFAILQGLDIPSSYAKVLGETNFPTQEFPRSGSKAEGVQKRRRKKEEKSR